MKKNITMRIAAFLFILTMISTCAFATTFAKYTTSGESTDSARVAKFGVTITAPSANELFVQEYNADSTEAGVPTLTVQATTDVVAPGTSGDLAAFKVEGTPEVAVEVKYEAVLTLSNWVVDGTDYCPIVFTINGDDYTQNANESAADFAARVSAVINAHSVVNAPNTEIDDSFEFSWAWAYSTGDANDAKDTALGDAAAYGTAPTISLVIKCTVTQID